MTHGICLWIGTILAMSGGLPTQVESGPAVAVARKYVLTLEGARAAVAAAAVEARKAGVGGSVAVTDDGGHLLYLERWDNTFPASAAVATGKARTAATFRFPTKKFEDAIRGGRHSLTAVTEMVPLEGGVPIVINGEVVGAVGVSGTASSQQDVDFAEVAARAVAAAHERSAGR